MKAVDQPAKVGSTNWQTVEPFEQAKAKMHRRPFRVTHGLAGNQLFSLPALMEVAKEASKRRGDCYADTGDVKVTDKWGNIPLVDRPIDEVIDRIQSAGAWIIMKHIEIDPAYAAVLNEFADFVQSMAPSDPRFSISNPEMLILITSPKRLTSFHFDAEVNFLVQIQGSKRVWVCNPEDRSAITDSEIERYYVGNQSAGTYKPGVENRASTFELNPGEGVYIPSHGAHWVQNGDNVSVSLSLNFELPPSTYKYPSITNYALRRLGVQPRPLGQSLAADRLKAITGAVAWRGLQTALWIKNGGQT
jgi:hypothetical protein